ncbi:MAG: hypothetical protein KA791_06220 [Flavobacteriales bacterium]|nr:hypothetical protein [Flavobacteriales bacterium]
MFEGEWVFAAERMLSELICTSGTTYDLEALIEHAIVHVIRHRLRLEKLLARAGT